MREIWKIRNKFALGCTFAHKNPVRPPKRQVVVFLMVLEGLDGVGEGVFAQKKAPCSMCRGLGRHLQRGKTPTMELLLRKIDAVFIASWACSIVVKIAALLHW